MLTIFLCQETAMKYILKKITSTAKSPLPAFNSKKKQEYIDQFIEEFLNARRAKDRRLIIEKYLLRKNLRLTLNLPWIGLARLISKELLKYSFSSFYLFEKELSALLHPFLANWGFNFFTINTLENSFYKILAKNDYTNIIPFTKGIDNNLKLLTAYKKLIKTIALEQGPYMVIYFAELVIGKKHKELGQLISQLEHSTIRAKLSISKNKEKTIINLKKLFEEFKKINPEENLFIERISWEPELKDYAYLLTDKEERRKVSTTKPIKYEMRASETNKIAEAYAQKTKNLLKSFTPENLVGQMTDKFIKNNGLTVEEANSLAAKITAVWLDDPEVNIETKKNLKQIQASIDPELNTSAPVTEPETEELIKTETVVPESDWEQAVSEFIDHPESASEEKTTNLEIIASSDLTPLEETNDNVENKYLPQNTEATEGQLKISADEELPEELIPIDQQQEQETIVPESTEAPILNPEESSKNPVKELALSALDKIKNYIQSKLKSVENLEAELAKEFKKVLQEIKSIDEQDEENKIEKVLQNLNNYQYEGFSKELLKTPAIVKDNFFADLMHKLVDLSERLKVVEMRAFLEHLIDQVKKNDLLLKKYPYLVGRLENFKNSLRETKQDFLPEINITLNQIRQQYPEDKQTCLEEQYNYLEDCYKNPKFTKVRSTLLTIMRNILNIDLDEFNEIERIMHNDNLAKQKIFKNLEESTKINFDPGRTDYENYLQQNQDIANIKFFKLAQLAELAEDEFCPRVIQETAQDLQDKFKIKEKDRFDDLFLTITASANCHAMKIKFLYTLGVIANSYGWLNPERKKLLENKIRFYENLLAAYRPKILQKAVTPVAEPSPTIKQQKINKTTENIISSDKKPKEHKEKSEIELTIEEKQILKTVDEFMQYFGHHYELVPSIISYLLDYLPAAIKNEVTKSLTSYSLIYKQIYTNTIEGLDKKTNNLTSLLKAIHDQATKTPRSLYVWLKIVQEYKKSEDLNSIFSFLNEESQAELTTLLKIYKVNNKGDLLKTSIEKEIKLLTDFNNALANKQWKKLDIRKSKWVNSFKNLLQNINYPAAETENNLAAEKSIVITKEEKTIEPETKITAVNSTAKDKLDTGKARYEIIEESIAKNLKDFLTSLTTTNESVKRLQNKYIRDINENLFEQLIKNEPNVLKFCAYNKDKLIILFKTIIDKKLTDRFSNIKMALAYCLNKQILNKEDLK